ncbi:hypothetical protein [Paraburkholderia dinghuensis]|uniref:hypothetical protein n=1 Tax=Paraburkholderia dinghuensis TaxID=2305225 RepID=UPI002696CA92
MLESVPGCYIAIGNGASEWHGCHVHNPGYEFNDEAIPVGASIWAHLADNVHDPRQVARHGRGADMTRFG